MDLLNNFYFSNYMCSIVFILIAMHPFGLGVKKNFYFLFFWDLILLPNLVDFAKKQNTGKDYDYNWLIRQIKYLHLSAQAVCTQEQDA